MGIISNLFTRSSRLLDISLARHLRAVVAPLHFAANAPPPLAAVGEKASFRASSLSAAKPASKSSSVVTATALRCSHVISGVPTPDVTLSGFAMSSSVSTLFSGRFSSVPVKKPLRSLYLRAGGVDG